MPPWRTTSSRQQSACSNKDCDQEVGLDESILDTMDSDFEEESYNCGECGADLCYDCGETKCVECTEPVCDDCIELVRNVKRRAKMINIFMRNA
mmetsp:Transcript_14424/g.21266  ORF Transcript_14424/g.21266 Transcript_14424/m.21266 type:complete len:94 (+) Transcript_14424:85-366(+)